MNNAPWFYEQLSFTTSSYNIEPDKILLEDSRPRYGEEFHRSSCVPFDNRRWHPKNQSVHLVTPLNWKLLVHIIATLHKISLTLNIS